MSSEIEVEPVPGLPENLPPGEQILWQGRPAWKSLARRTFKLGWLAFYFAFFATTRAVVVREEGQGMSGVLGVLSAVALGAVCIGLLSLFARLQAGATMYTITNRRVVMRIGVALPTSFNLPFKCLASADVDASEGGDGDIALTIAGTDRIAWLHLWPHAQPWHFAKARPMLRAIPEAQRVATLLAEAVQTWAATQAEPVLVRARGAEDSMVTIERTSSEGAMSAPRELATEAGR
jgi:hypothetical protein